MRVYIFEKCYLESKGVIRFQDLGDVWIRVKIMYQFREKGFFREWGVFIDRDIYNRNYVLWNGN